MTGPLGSHDTPAASSQQPGHGVRPRSYVVPARRGWLPLLILFTILQVGSARTAAQQQAGEPEPPPAAPQADTDQQPTFRGGIDFVRVDAIVTDRQGRPVADLTAADFQVLENGTPQTIEQFRLIKVDGRPQPDAPAARPIRTSADEELEAARDDVRMFAIFLDDYHVRDVNSLAIRAPLLRFIETQLRPEDMVAVMYPMTPIDDVFFSRDHAAVARAIQQFQGRKYDYTPRNRQEESYSRYPTETVERIRNDVVMGALRGLAMRMGSLRDARKSIIFVSEGFTVMLPPQMRRADASQPIDPFEAQRAAGAEGSQSELTAEWFSQSDLNSRMRDVFDAANRNNTAVYSLDPRGLAVSEFSLSDGPGAAPGFATDARMLRATQDTLRILSEETDGRAIVNRNTLDEGLAQIVRDSSFYYLLGYTSQAPSDGKFHPITVRVNRRNVQVRARKGFWAFTEADVLRATTPAGPDVATPVQQALASIASPARSHRYVQTWVGTERAENGRTRVTLVWEPLPQTGDRREQAGRVSILAADGNGDLVFRGRTPDVAPPSNTPDRPGDRAPAAGGAASSSTGPQRLVFDAPPGKLELRMTVEATGGGGTLDNEVRTIDVPDLTVPQAGLSTPRVFRSRNAREFQAHAADGTAIPVAAREFSRAERLLIRFDAYGAGSNAVAPTAALLNRAGQKMMDLPVAAAAAGGTHQIDLGLNSLAAGEYLVEITLEGEGGAATELVPLRVGS